MEYQRKEGANVIEGTTTSQLNEFFPFCIGEYYRIVETS